MLMMQKNVQLVLQTSRHAVAVSFLSYLGHVMVYRVVQRCIVSVCPQLCVIYLEQSDAASADS